MMLVGEQPGDQEDKAGTPFVGVSDLRFAAERLRRTAARSSRR
jgi:uracil-DNA glycosylase